MIDRQTALDHYERLEALGFKAAGLHLDGSPLDARKIAEFRSRYGNDQSFDGANQNSRAPSVGDHR
jgi:hypothetical protein